LAEHLLSGTCLKIVRAGEDEVCQALPEGGGVDRRAFLTGCAVGFSMVAHTETATEKSWTKSSSEDPPIVIDAHAHYGYMGMWGQRDVSIEEILVAADDAGIDKFCLSSIEALSFDMEEGNKAIYLLMKRYPGRVIGFGTLPAPYFGKRGLDEIQRAVEVYGMKGVGELETTARYPLDNPNWIAVLEKAADLKVPVLVHSVDGPCARAAERVPEATILLAHLGAGYGIAVNEWLDAIEMAKTHPNVYLETCQSDISYGQIEMAVKELGPERIVFGTDSPLLDPAVQKTKVTGADISPKAKQLILGRNMARLLQISSSL
jgi:predicted TIM-barrel fold metal-dependent hydrolase